MVRKCVSVSVCVKERVCVQVYTQALTFSLAKILRDPSMSLKYEPSSEPLTVSVK